jgi:hypothetical protein
MDCLPRVRNRRGEIGVERHGVTVLVGKQPHDALEQVDRGRIVGTVARSSPRRRQDYCSSTSKTTAALVRRLQLDAVTVGALEVIAEDLLELRRLRFEPVGEPLVEIGPPLLPERLLGRVAQEEVLETKRVLGCGPDHVCPDERLERLRETFRQRLRRELRDRVEAELLALDSRALDEAALVRRQAIEPRSEQSLDRRRDGHVAVAARAPTLRECGALAARSRRRLPRSRSLPRAARSR